MNISDIRSILWGMMIQYEWFSDKITIDNNNLIVHVDTMNLDVFNSIPDNLFGYEIKVHYALAYSDKYATNIPKSLAQHTLLSRDL